MSVCKYCSGIGHSAFTCPRKPRSTLVAKKPMNKHGKYFKKWMQTREKWLQINKAPYYFCYICGKMMTKSQLTLDHVKSRSRYPELRYSLKNLQACCADCNQLKGSRELEEI